MSDVGTDVVTPVIKSWGAEPPKIRKKPHPWDDVIEEIRQRDGEWAEVYAGEGLPASKVTQMRKRNPDMLFTQRGDSVWVRKRTDEGELTPPSGPPDLDL